MSAIRFRTWVLVMLAVVFVVGWSHLAVAGSQAVKLITIPGEDRFTPFAVTVHVGQGVRWINNDTDMHNIISNDAFNTAGHKGLNHVILPGSHFTLKFTHPGVFPFYCDLHSTLDGSHQPKAPGPDGGITDPDGNFGTPMNGVVTVIP